MKALDELRAAIGESLDKLAKEGLYVERIRVDSEHVENPYDRMSIPSPPDRYRRVIQIELTTAVPNYANSR